MASIVKKGKSYFVRWREGDERPARKCPDKRTAEALKRQIEQNLALYGKGEPATPDPGLMHERLEAWLNSKRPDIKPRSIQSYQDGLVLFLRYLQEKTGKPASELRVTLLTRESLSGYHSWLVDTGRTASTAHKRCIPVLAAWQWMMGGEDASFLRAPPDRPPGRRGVLEAPIAPTWGDCDRCIAETRHTPWVYRAAVLARFTGIRRSEIVQLQWPYFNFEEYSLTVPASITKGGYGGRTVPFSPHLGAEMATWPRESQYVVNAPEGEMEAALNDGRGHLDRRLRRAWEAAGVPPELWRGQPTHSFRKALQTELFRVDISLELSDHLVGHMPQGIAKRHYLDPAAYWTKLARAVDLIPPLPSWETRSVINFPGSAAGGRR